jgi:hypothetical protein
MQEKEITIVFYGRNFTRGDWRFEVNEESLACFFADLTEELAPLGVDLRRIDDHRTVLDVRGYGDLLNTVRIRSPKDGVGNLCLGHIIGASAECDLLQDIRRGINRVAFAPETIEPEGSDKMVCHNCGCGC